MADTLYIRADASNDIGFGHMVRCLALADMLKNDCEIVFVALLVPDSIKEKITGSGHQFRIIDRENEFVDSLTKGETVVIDHYSLGTAYQNDLKSKGCKIVCIDDLHNIRYHADLIINQAPGIIPGNYSAEPYTQYALGLDYILLRPAFLENQGISKSRDLSEVFVCFGGTDQLNLTQRTVDVLKSDDRFRQINVVVGEGYKFYDQLKKSVEVDLRFTVYRNQDDQGMVDIIRKSGLAIVPASSILNEVIAMGCRVITGMYVDNQKYVLSAYTQMGAVVSTGSFGAGDIVHAIDGEFESPATNQIEYIDKKSRQRLRRLFSSLFLEDSITIRKVDYGDLKITLTWANNSNVRRFSFNKNQIEFGEHEKWFINKIGSDQVIYLMALLNDQPIGSIRFDIASDVANISYLIDPAHHGLGYGSILLKMGIRYLVENKTNLAMIQGDVLPGNVASVKIFERLGFKKQHLENRLRYTKHLSI